MFDLRIKLIGYPEIKKNSEVVFFPYKKAEGILYMLLIEEQMEREKICNYFWPDTNSQTAKKNLRNAVYNLRKKLGDDIILSPKRSILKINKEIITEIDIDNFISKDINKDKDLKSIIKMSTQELLEGFYIGNLYEFENWLYMKRSEFINKYNEFLNNLLKSNINNALKILICQKLIEVDQFDEKSYIKLIDLYKIEGNYKKCIDVYNKLEKKLSEELSITPSKEVIDMVEKILIKRQIKFVNQKKSSEICFGREKEIELINKNYNLFLQNNEFSNYLLYGEAGIGKTNLINTLISNVDNCFILKMNCYQFEEDYSYESWKTPLDQISEIIKNYNIEIPCIITKNINSLFPSFVSKDDMDNYIDEERNYKLIQKSILNIFSIINKIKKIILVVEDIHWIDKTSLEILRALISNKISNIFILMSCRNINKEKIDKFLYYLKNRKLINIINLKRFSEKETKELINHFIKIDKKSQDIIYKESEGNPLFIMEYINNIQQNKDFNILNSRAGDVIKSRIVNIPLKCRKLLEICSVFVEFIHLEALENITKMSKIDIIDILDELMSRKLINEDSNLKGEIVLYFSHSKIKTYLYNSMSESKKSLLHSRFAEYYELLLNDNNNRSTYFPKLIYHYQACDNKIKHFEYRLKRFTRLVMMNHEMFPNIEEYNINDGVAVYLDKNEINIEINKLKKMYNELKNNGNDEYFEELKIIYLHIIGRMHIGMGNEKEGEELTRNMIKTSEKIYNHNYILKGCFNLIHLSINTFNLNMMQDSISHAENKLHLIDDRGLKAKLMRLNGYMKILNGNYCEGERLLEEAIGIFVEPEYIEKYILNVAASYLYIGESRRLQEKFEEALLYYDKSYNIFKEKRLITGMAIVLSNIGRTYYENEKIDKSKELLVKSLKYYNKIVFIWGRFITHGYLSLIYAREKNEKLSYKHFNEAFNCINKTKNIYEKGVMCRIEAEIILITQKFKNHEDFIELIKSNINNCFQGKIKCFENCAMTYEKTIIKKLIKNEKVSNVLIPSS